MPNRRGRGTLASGVPTLDEDVIRLEIADSRARGRERARAREDLAALARIVRVRFIGAITLQLLPASAARHLIFFPTASRRYRAPRDVSVLDRAAMSAPSRSNRSNHLLIAHRCLCSITLIATFSAPFVPARDTPCPSPRSELRLVSSVSSTTVTDQLVAASTRPAAESATGVPRQSRQIPPCTLSDDRAGILVGVALTSAHVLTLT